MNAITVHHYVILSAALFAIGFYGAVSRRNAVAVLMCVELMLNAVNINMLAFSRYVTPAAVTGQVFTVFVITVAAAEVAVGLALVINIYRNMNKINVDDINIMKW